MMRSFIICTFPKKFRVNKPKGWAGYNIWHARENLQIYTGIC